MTIQILHEHFLKDSARTDPVPTPNPSSILRSVCQRPFGLQV